MPKACPFFVYHGVFLALFGQNLGVRVPRLRLRCGVLRSCSTGAFAESDAACGCWPGGVLVAVEA